MDIQRTSGIGHNQRRECVFEGKYTEHCVKLNSSLFNWLIVGRTPVYTFSPHTDFEAFLEATVLALVAVVLVYGTVPVGPACVAEIPPDAAFEEALTSFACELSVVLPAGFIPAYNTLDLLALVFVHGRRRRGGGRRIGAVIIGRSGGA